MVPTLTRIQPTPSRPVTLRSILHHHHHHDRLSRIRPLGLFLFQNLFSETYGELVGLLGRGIGPTQGLYLQTGQHNTEKRGHIFMPLVGFELMIPVFERLNTTCLRPLGHWDRLRSILILLSHLSLGLPHGLFPSVFPIKFLYFSSLPYVLHAQHNFSYLT
jgi:hypothetical protein